MGVLALKILWFYRCRAQRSGAPPAPDVNAAYLLRFLSQPSQPFWSSAGTCRSSHVWHCSPSWSDTVPGGQRSQAVWSALLCLPRPQLVHVCAATPDTVPVAHGVHVSELLLCRVPASHLVHTGCGVHSEFVASHVVLNEPEYPSSPR